MSFAEYKQIEKMNASTLVHGLHSMRRLKRYMDKGFEEEDTLCKTLGVATHALLLEPEEFERQYVVMPDYHLDPENMTGGKKPEQSTSKATKYCKEKIRQFCADNAGRIVIPREAYDKCLYAIEQIRSHHSAPSMLEDAEFEKYIDGNISGIPFKGRLDIISVKHRRIVDLKTTFNAQPHVFGRTAANQNYDFKLAIYRELFRQNYGFNPEVKMIVQEIGGDFDTCVVNVADIVLDNAAGDVQRVIDGMKASQYIGKWFGVDQGMKEVELVVPNWKMRDELEEADWDELNTEVEQAF